MPRHPPQHTSRFTSRQRVLDECFATPKLKKAWKRYVRDGMRHQPVADLHDYYEFHKNQTDIFGRIKAEILEGRYRPKIPVTLRAEKRAGLTRRLCIPAAEDAVVLQTLTDYMYHLIRKKQPSENAFFSRSHGFTPPDIREESTDYGWFFRWRDFSKKRLALPTEFAYLAISDVANYYDNVDHQTLRKVLSSIFLCDEVILDFLFMILQGLSWTPDYLPSSGRGLPQVDFDAPRLLAHAFLFEVDAYLKGKTDDRFLRWVDDITIPADTKSEAGALLHGVDELLMTRGLRLNTGKTIILDATEAVTYFWRDENNFLDVFQGRVRRLREAGVSTRQERRQLRRRFERFKIMARSGAWSKVLKRYFTVFGDLGDAYLEKEFLDVMRDVPEVRSWALRYYSRLGPSKRRLVEISAFLKDEHIVDDVSIFRAAEAMVAWEPAPRGRVVKDLRQFAQNLGRERFARRSEMFFLAGLWLLAKYGTQQELQAHILLNKRTWSVSSYLARQVAAATARLSRQRVVEEIRRDLFQFGQLDAVGVISHLEQLGKARRLPQETLSYLRPRANVGKPYPLSKFLILVKILRSRELPADARSQLRRMVMDALDDRVYLAHLRNIRIRSGGPTRVSRIRQAA